MAETQRIPDQIAQSLRKEILAKFKVGDRLPNVIQLAQRFDVSKHSVSCALDILAREGLIEKWQGSGVYVKEQVDERAVAVVLEIDFAAPDVSYFWRQVTQQVRLLLAAQGVPSRLYAGFHRPGLRSGDPTCRELIDDVGHNRLKGVIVTYGSLEHEWANALQQHGVPMVGHYPPFENYVMLDLTKQVRTATRRLLAAGRRKLAFMDWGARRPGHDSQDELFKAFAETLAAHGVPLNEHWIRSEFHPNTPGAGWEEFREIWMGSAEKPDGLVVTDDVLFHGVARAIGEFGIRVPEQLLVATHSNLGALEDYPFPLWRIVTDPDATAQAQVDLLLALLRGEPVAQRQVVLSAQLVVPDATAVDNPGARETKQSNKVRSSLS